jgi:hypothetical protein
MALWLILTIGSVGAVGQLFDTVGGVGFGTFSTSVVVVSGFSPAVAIAAVNLAKVGSGTASGLAHWKVGNVRWRWVLPLTVTGVLGGIAGGMMIAHTPEQQLRPIITWILLILGVMIVYRHWPRQESVAPVAGGCTDAAVVPSSRWPEIRRKGAFIGLGAAAGVVNAVSGAYGAFATPALMMARQARPRFMVGSVNFAEIFVAGASAITIMSQIELTEELWTIWAALVIGAVITAPIGAVLTRRVNPRFLALAIGFGLVGLNSWNLVRQ